ncbi:phosphotransferase, partial [Microbacterium sp. CPCC 204701]|uniref:phosphotransferase n=1 Tax=Microbacterium sp. CPCC 204701 TaxID=2493084 RepID=UPI000FDAB592
ETGLGDSHAVVVDFLPGYRVDAAHLPPGRGAATSLGAALAALHALPQSVVRAEGLPARTPQQVRADVVRLIDRASATRRLPSSLETRWRRAADADELWRFESSIVLGGAGAASFLFEDIEGVPTVTGLLDWHGLSIGDAASDLQWLASAPDAADDVYAAYVAGSERAPDARTRERARLYAELEFAQWLVHGHDSARDDIVADAAGLLESLAAGVAGDELVPNAALDVDDAIALLDRVPGATAPAIDTSMHTDAYDPEELSQWVTDEFDDEPSTTDAATPEGDTDPVAPAAEATLFDDTSTAPVDLLAAVPRGPASIGVEQDTLGAHGAADTDAAADAERASEAALRRWLAD